MSQNPRTDTNREQRHADQPGRTRRTYVGQYELVAGRRSTGRQSGRRSTGRQSKHRSTGQQAERSQQGEQGQQAERIRQSEQTQQGGQIQQGGQSQPGGQTRQSGRTQRRYGQHPSRFADTRQSRGTDQQSYQGDQQRGQGSQVEQGLQYGGEARHGHEDTHVGDRRTYGEPDREHRQQGSELPSPERWDEERREYPMAPEGRERNDQGDRHGDQGNRSQGGRRYGQSRR